MAERAVIGLAEPAGGTAGLEYRFGRPHQPGCRQGLFRSADVDGRDVHTFAGDHPGRALQDLQAAPPLDLGGRPRCGRAPELLRAHWDETVVGSEAENAEV